MSDKTMRLSFPTRETTSAQAAEPPVIEIFAPAGIRDCTLRREPDESQESYEARKSLFDTLLKLGEA